MRYSLFATFSALIILSTAYPIAAPHANLVTERVSSSGNKLNSHNIAIPNAKSSRGLLGDVTENLNDEWDNVEDDLKQLPDAIKFELATKKPRGFFDDIKDHAEDLWEKTKDEADELKDEFKSGIKNELGI